MTRLETATLPGFFQGLPFRGTSIPNLKSGDAEIKLPALATEAHIKVFSSAKEEDMQEYAKIIEKLTAGTAIVGVKRVVFEKESKSFLVYLEWAEFAYIDPVDNTGTPIRITENKIPGEINAR